MAFSVYNYLSTTKLAELIHTMASVTDADTAAKFISDAERLVDVWVGPQLGFYPELTLELTATLASGATTLQSSTLGSRRPDYWAQGGVYVVAKDGPSGVIREKRLVVGSDDNQLTLASGFSGQLTAGTGKVVLRQESKFPRFCDMDTQGDPFLPFELEAAVAYQVEFGIHYGSEEYGLGDSDVTTDQGDIQSRSYGSGYSEARSSTHPVRGLGRMMAPRTKALLRNLVNSTGYLRR